MRRSIITSALLCTLCICSTNSQGQEIDKPPDKLPAFKKGSSTIALGIGSGGGFTYYGTPTSTPLITGSIETAYFDNVGIGTIGIGAIAGVKYTSVNPIVGSKAEWYHLIFAPRATYHFVFHHAFDPYVGATLGVSYTIHDDSYYNSINATPYSQKAFKLVGGVFAGAKYNITRWLGVFVEAGLDVSRFRVGVNFNKLNN